MESDGPQPPSLSWTSWVAPTGGAQLLGVLLGAVTNIAYARFLSITVVGELAILIALAALTVAVGEAGLGIFVTRALARGEVTVGSALALLLYVSPLFVALAWLAIGGVALAAAPLRDALALNGGSLLLVLELALAQWLFQANLVFYQGTRRYSLRGGLIIANAVLTTGLTFAALAFEPTLRIAIHASVAAYAVVGLVGVVPALGRHRPKRPSVAEGREIFAQARPIWLNNGVFYLSSGADVLLVGILLPTATVGVYQVVRKLAIGLLAPITSLLPVASAEASRGDIRTRTRLYRAMQVWMAGLVGIGILLLSPFCADIVSALFGTAYGARSDLLLILIVVGALRFSEHLLGALMIAKGWFHRSLHLATIVGVASICLATAFGLGFGIYGFVAGSVLAEMLGIVIALRMATPRVVEPSGRSTAAGLALLLGSMGIALVAASIATSAAIALSVTAAALGALWFWRAASRLATATKPRSAPSLT